MNNKNKISLSWSTKVLNIKITKTEIKKILKRNVTITNKNDKSTKCNISKYYTSITIIQNNNHIIIHYTPYLKNGGGGGEWRKMACEVFLIKEKEKGFLSWFPIETGCFAGTYQKTFPLPKRKSNTYPRLKVDLKIFWRIFFFRKFKEN